MPTIIFFEDQSKCELKSSANLFWCTDKKKGTLRTLFLKKQIILQVCLGLLTFCGPMFSSFELISRPKLKMTKKQKSELFLKG